MGSVSVSSCRCCMFVSCVHSVAVLNAAFCMTCRLLQTTQPTSGGSVTADSSCCANCVEPPRPQQWGPDLLFSDVTVLIYVRVTHLFDQM